MHYSHCIPSSVNRVPWSFAIWWARAGGSSLAARISSTQYHSRHPGWPFQDSKARRGCRQQGRPCSGGRGQPGIRIIKAHNRGEGR